MSAVGWDGLEVYRVRERTPAYRRKWQVEWDGAMWASRGYSRRGAVAGARFRRGHPRIDRAYVRVRRALRWLVGKGDARTYYTPTGRWRDGVL